MWWRGLSLVITASCAPRWQAQPCVAPTYIYRIHTSTLTRSTQYWHAELSHVLHWGAIALSTGQWPGEVAGQPRLLLLRLHVNCASLIMSIVFLRLCQQYSIGQCGAPHCGRQLVGHRAASSCLSGPQSAFLAPQLATRAARARFRLQVKLQSKCFLFSTKSFCSFQSSSIAQQSG